LGLPSLLVPGRLPINYYICAGLDPTKDIKNPVKVAGIMEIGSVVFNLFVFLRIRVFKKRTKTDLVTKRSNFLKDLFLSDINAQSMASLSVNICNLFNIALSKLSLSILNRIEPEKFSQHGGLIFTHYMIYPCFVIVLYLGHYYAYHEPLKIAFKNEMNRILRLN
jgi:hypothetical protein